MKSQRFALTLAGVLLARAVMADSLVIPGAGRAGTWDIVIDVSNGGGEPVSLEVGPVPSFPTGCPALCPLPFRILQPGESTSITADDVSHFLPGLGLAYLNSATGDFSRVTARAYTQNTAFPAQTAEIPINRLSTIAALNPQVLIFPGARKSVESRSNLFLTEPSGQANLTATVEILDSGGGVLALQTVTVPAGAILYLVDVIGTMGVPALANGGIRVTRVQGGLLWGWLGTNFPGAGVNIGLGINP
jgi:hypothetical protein